MVYTYYTVLARKYSSWALVIHNPLFNKKCLFLGVETFLHPLDPP